MTTAHVLNDRMADKHQINVDDEQNVLLVGEHPQVDELNASFYGRFPFPWRPARLERPGDTDFARIMLCQDLGDWRQEVVPRKPRIWVAGCGTNQAVMTALSFPEATVIGSDLSQPSLDLSARTAKELSVSNLELKCESLNDGSYRDEFDYVICTGVIHHNADPQATLARLGQALKPNGILELMVYNKFHRTQVAAVQKALRILCGPHSGAPGDDVEKSIIDALIRSQVKGRVGAFLQSFQDANREEFADWLMQPVEHSYTVHSLNRMVEDCGLELLAPCINQFDKAQGTYSWNMMLADPSLRQRYLDLDDIERWRVTNLLLEERSPMLWFHVGRVGRAVQFSQVTAYDIA